MDELARLKESITRHAGEGVTRTALPGVSVLCSPTTTEPLGDLVEPTLGVIAQGVKETTLNGRTFTYGAGQFLIVSVKLPLVGHIAQASAGAAPGLRTQAAPGDDRHAARRDRPAARAPRCP
jgi:hypothetical protein